MLMLENLQLLRDISCFLRNARARILCDFFPLFCFLLLCCIIRGCIKSGIKARLRLDVAKLNLRKLVEKHEKQKEEKIKGKK
jgi:hypothetical protein